MNSFQKIKKSLRETVGVRGFCFCFCFEALAYQLKKLITDYLVFWLLLFLEFLLMRKVQKLEL